MKKLLLALALIGFGATYAISQTFKLPPPAGVVVMGCVYQGASAPVPTTTGLPYYVQCNSSGQLLTNATATSATIGSVTQGTIPWLVDTLTTSNNLYTVLMSAVTGINSSIPAGTNNIGNVGQISQYPTGATAITAAATGTTSATTATLAGTGGKTTYICTSSIRANATAATTVTDAITGVITGTMSALLWVAPAASGLGVDEQVFTPCVPASGTNTGIAIVSGAPGSGGNVTVHATGYQL